MRPRQLRDEDPVRRTATEVVSAALHPRNPVVELPCGKLIIEICMYILWGGWEEKRKAATNSINSDGQLCLSYF